MAKRSFNTTCNTAVSTYRSIILSTLLVTFSSSALAETVSQEQANTLSDALNKGFENTQTLATDEAFVLVKVGVRGELKQYVSSLNFAASGYATPLEVPKENGFQLIKVKAGTYQPTAFGIAKPSKKQEPKAFANSSIAKKAIVIEPGTVTYIGKWDIAYGKRVTWLDKSITTKQSAFRVSYSVESVQAFAETNQWLTEFPLRISHISGNNVATSWDYLDQAKVN